jgi:hypothetical protein
MKLLPGYRLVKWFNDQRIENRGVAVFWPFTPPTFLSDRVY